MKIRFEVARRKTYFWPYFVKRAKDASRYRVEASEGVELHIVEASSLDEAMPVWQCVRSWKAVSIEVDGKPVGNLAFSNAMVRHQFRNQRTRNMLDDVIRKAERRRDGGDDARWRMGLGPKPEE